ncbi:siderophore-interacting protein [Jatrophihabitans endophyticus]|uniref:siderophore-interacting protein n=1 Tax=Jatrophihabitans endophyticus TaxID=1206085 RepID=UPI0019ECC58E|nr:siderophore-interacting protein [Jatrophihabitans endophyticus]MBE7186721.1 siderophore-interacting protein [Jatrophihabitans endophyticus]
MSAASPRPLPTAAVVESTSRLAPDLVRLVLSAPDWSGFGDPSHADSYVKLVFLTPGVEYDRPIDPARIRAERPAEHWPRMRTYTVRAFDRAAGTLTVDVVTHGTQGLAGPWARSARPGDEVLIAGPGGGYDPDHGADWHLLAGDESALPAIAVALERMPAGARGAAFVEVAGPADEIALTAPGGVAVRWLHRGSGVPGSALVPAVRAWALPPGSGHAFVHGEAAAVKELRRYLRVEHGLPMDRLSISGYWRAGADDEAWRSIKRAWNAEIEAAESAPAADDHLTGRQAVAG